MNLKQFTLLDEITRGHGGRRSSAAALVLVDGWTVSDAAHAVGITRAAVSNRVNTLRDLHQRVRAAYRG